MLDDSYITTKEETHNEYLFERPIFKCYLRDNIKHYPIYSKSKGLLIPIERDDDIYYQVIPNSVLQEIFDNFSKTT